MIPGLHLTIRRRGHQWFDSLLLLSHEQAVGKLLTVMVRGHVAARRLWLLTPSLNVNQESSADQSQRDNTIQVNVNRYSGYQAFCGQVQLRAR